MIQPDLSRRDVMAQRDPRDMLGLTEGFADQCRQALFRSREIPVPNGRPRSVIVTGMGGSAMAGDFVAAAFAASGRVPFSVNRFADLPAHVGPDDLVFCASYSGDTEETVSAFEMARARGATTVAVTSGGELGRRRADRHIPVPAGQPPRTALGAMTIPILDLCARLGLVEEPDFEDAFDGLEVGIDDEEPREIARRLHGRFPMLYGTGRRMGVAAERWRAQIHENAKMLAHSNVFPELTHNEIIGWQGWSSQGVDPVVVLLVEPDGPEADRIRREVIRARCPATVEVTARGRSPLARMLKTAHLGDWVSLYLARLNEVDPGEIVAIDELKAALAAHESGDPPSVK